MKLWRRIFWDYKNSFFGPQLVAQIVKKSVLAPAVILGSIIATQYVFTSSVYYDEYDGDVSERKPSTEEKHH